MKVIDADALMTDICDSMDKMTEVGIPVDGEWLWAKLNHAIKHAPTIEPERKKGKWKKGGEQPYFRKHFDIVVCSICNKRGEHRWNFCPNCGADMRGDKK